MSSMTDNKHIEFSEKPDEKTGLLLPKGARKLPIGFARALKENER